MEQRYHAVMEVLSGASVTEVAGRYAVSRQSVHAWLSRYETDGLPGLADRSHRPQRQPRQIAVEVEALICQLRRAHPRWGPRRLVFELGKAGVDPVPSRSTVYRVLVRHQLVQARKRRRRREDYVRWERPASMQLWQLDITGSVFLVDGTELKLVSGVDDHSRYCVIATVVRRAYARAVCAAFVVAMAEYGIPEEVLSDNGKQFTGRFTRPRPGEVLFERICRHNGIKQRLTRPYSPTTTTGKVERWHQTLQRELLEQAGPFPTIEAAQAAVDAWRVEYNTQRPHQSLDMATPASRFQPNRGTDEVLPLWVPASLEPAQPSTSPVQDDVRIAAPAVAESRAWPDAVEVDRVVPASGNMTVGPQQFWLGLHRAGQTVTLWMDTTTVHLSINGSRIKTVPSRLSTVDLARLRTGDARPAGPPPAGRWPGQLATSQPVEVDRTARVNGTIALAGHTIQVGSPLAGQRVRLRLDGPLLHVIGPDGRLWRSLPCPIPAEHRHRIQGIRIAGPMPQPADSVRVHRRVSATGATQVLNQPIQVGKIHAGQTVAIDIDHTCLRVLDQHGELLTVIPRITTAEVRRFKAYGTKRRS